MSNSLTEQELAAAVAELPPVSTVVQRLFVVLQDPHSDVDDLARLVRAETALSAQVLRLANSAAFALPEPASTIGEAIQRLGVTEVSNLVAVLANRQLFLRPLAVYGLTADALWQHTLAVAVAAETMAQNTGRDRGLAYIAGILHPVGLIALDRVAAARKLPPIAEGTPLLAWERENFASTNAHIAAHVLRVWNFPDAIAQIVAGRYQPESTGVAALDAGVLHAASCLAEKLGQAIPVEAGIFKATPERLEAIGLPWAEFSEVEMEAAHRLERTRAVLRLA